jgi:hypothetical protein
LLHVDRLALLDRALAGRQALAVGADVDVPAGDLFGFRLPPDAKMLGRGGDCRLLGLLGRGAAEPRAGRDQDAAGKDGGELK